jgi:hypothetical protein
LPYDSAYVETHKSQFLDDTDPTLGASTSPYSNAYVGYKTVTAGTYTRAKYEANRKAIDAKVKIAKDAYAKFLAKKAEFKQVEAAALKAMNEGKYADEAKHYIKLSTLVPDSKADAAKFLSYAAQAYKEAADDIYSTAYKNNVAVSAGQHAVAATYYVNALIYYEKVNAYKLNVFVFEDYEIPRLLGDVAYAYEKSGQYANAAIYYTKQAALETIPEVIADCKEQAALMTELANKAKETDAAKKDEAANKAAEAAKKAINTSAITLKNGGVFSYTGNAINFSFSLKNGGKTLIKGKDYNFTGVTKAVNAGTYSVTVTGMGSYKGSATQSWQIIQKPSTNKVKKITVGKKSMTVKWSKVKLNSAAKETVAATKYEISYRAKGSFNWKVKTVAGSKTSVKIKKLKKGKTYQVKIRAYKTVNTQAGAKKFYSSYSKIKKSKKVK